MKIELKVVDRKKKDVTYYDSLSGTAKCVPSYVVYHLKLIRYLGCKCYIVLGCFRKDLYPPHGGNRQYPPPPLGTSYTNLRHFLDKPYLSGRRKFPLWVGYRSFLERPIAVSNVNMIDMHALQALSLVPTDPYVNLP